MANDLQSSLVELAEAEAHKAELTHWLTRDLKARPSTHTQPLPLPLPAPVVTPASAFTAAAPSAIEVASFAVEEPPVSGSNAPDTLAPQVLAPPELGDDDFAVLPRRASLKGVGAALGGLRLGAWLHGTERGRHLRRLAAAALVLLFLCLLFVKLRPAKPLNVEAASAAAQPNTVMALLPPPPEEGALFEAEELDAPEKATALPKGLWRHKAVSETEEAEAAEDDGPRGPNVKRYADLPNRVLTRLEKALKDGTSKRSDGNEEKEPTPSEILESDSVSDR